MLLVFSVREKNLRPLPKGRAISTSRLGKSCRLEKTMPMIEEKIFPMEENYGSKENTGPFKDEGIVIEKASTGGWKWTSLFLVVHLNVLQQIQANNTSILQGRSELGAVSDQSSRAGGAQMHPRTCASG
ncbi:uncharacterized protein LOC104432952 [Eucalyptus grandis]|uniref:uncharacterized protein LOC104432952 n=1 Tax=Eucalyptus grandis TaxID=71139 RepID=UPI00192EE170|nr:uncharacterized protein LOC104432952 [Eucalyptus grandis]XP_039162447.1 uncharacterized protein LOC104432952 [Eucalyptus grandis]